MQVIEKAITGVRPPQLLHVLLLELLHRVPVEMDRSSPSGVTTLYPKPDLSSELHVRRSIDLAHSSGPSGSRFSQRPMW